MEHENAPRKTVSMTVSPTVRALVVVLCTCQCAFAADLEDLAGAWRGAITREGSVQLIDVRLQVDGDSLGGTYDVPELGLIDAPLQEVSASDSTLQLQILYGLFQLRHHPEIGQLTGGNAQWKPPLTLHLKRVAGAVDRPFATEDVELVNGAVSLKGTLVRPPGKGPFPALIAVHGSGDQGRGMWEYRSHAYALSRQGIAVLLYDKRGVGESSGDHTTADLAMLADDAAAWLRLLRSRADIRGSAVGLLGISQGGWVSAVASSRGADPAFIVMLQGPAVSLEQQELHRVQYSMQADGVTQPDIDAAIAHTRAYFDFVNTSRGWDRLKASSDRASASSWADYVNVPSAPDDEDVLWWRRNAYDPEDDLKKLTCPVLAIFGEYDTAVPPAENRARMESYLAEAGVPFSTVVVPGLGHSVTTHHTLKGGEWSWPEHFWVWSRRPAAMDAAIADWVSRHSG